MMTYQPPTGPQPYSYPPATPGPAPVTPYQKKADIWRWVVLVGVAIIALCIGIAIGAAGKSSSKKAAAAPAVTVSAVVTTTPTQVISTAPGTVTTVTFTPTPQNSFTDGVQLIGTDIPAGNYKTAGPPPGGSCYYGILNSANTQDIEDNNNITGPARVTLPSGKYFDTSGGCQWAKQ